MQEAKTWVRGQEEMWACGTSNLPVNGDFIRDFDGSTYRVNTTSSAGFILEDTKDSRRNPADLQGCVAWDSLAYWFNQH